MGRALICLGDRTSHGGVVITATPYTTTGGRRIARIGDMVKCPKKGHGTCPIVTGDRTFIIDGSPVARHGDKTACGASLIAGQHNTRADTISSPDETVVYDNHAENSAENVFWNNHDDEEHYTELAKDQYDDHYIILDPHTHQPIAKSAYALILANGETIYGKTDGSGRTQLVKTAYTPDVVEIYIQGAA